MLRSLILFGTLISIWMIASDTAYASHITMVIENTISVYDDAVEMSLEVRNEGDEDSLVVYPFIRIGDIEKRLKQVPYIAFEGSSRWTERFLLKDIGWTKKGIYPLYLWIHYHDQFMYPFSVVQISPVNYGQVSTPLVLNGRVTAGTLGRKGKFSFSLENSGVDELEGRYELAVPDELLVSGDQESFFKIEPGKKQEWEVEIQNETALPSSGHNLHVVAQYDVGSIPTTQIFSDQISVVQSEPDRSNKLLIGGVAFICFLFLLTSWIEIRTPAERV